MKFTNYFKDERKKYIVAIISIVLTFSIIYLGSYYYNVWKINGEKDAATSAQTSTQDAIKPLKDEFIVMFMKENDEGKEEIYYKSSIRELKEKFKLEKMSENDLEKLLKEDGYKKVKRENSHIVFSKEEGAGLKANKYYIGSMDGILAIYKTDEKGVPYIEKAEDITEITISMFPEIDQEKIKNFSIVYDTREECEEGLTAYTS